MSVNNHSVAGHALCLQLIAGLLWIDYEQYPNWVNETNIRTHICPVLQHARECMMTSIQAPRPSEEAETGISRLRSPPHVRKLFVLFWFVFVLQEGVEFTPGYPSCLGRAPQRVYD